MALHDIMQSPVFPITSNGHLLAHIIGRSTSKNFGSNGENFLRCPLDFNNGCFHGFFENTLVKVDDPAAVAESICESIPAHLPRKHKSHCYHGAGHVFMMNEAHHLDRAIELCVSLPESWPESCWQGVFMENAGEREWELKKKNFREDAPLYPCTHVEDRFKPECYINHHGYLIRHYSKSWDKLAEACMGAGNFTRYCIGGLGLMLSNPYWVNVVAEEYGIGHLGHEEKVVFLCDALPDEHVNACYHYVVPGFLSYDTPDLTRISYICSMVEKQSHSQKCFERVGLYLPNLINDKSEREKACGGVPKEYMPACLGKVEKVREAFEENGGGCSGLSGKSREKCLSGFAEEPVSVVDGRTVLLEEDYGSLSFFERVRYLFAFFLRMLTGASSDGGNSGAVKKERIQERAESRFPAEASEGVDPVFSGSGFSSEEKKVRAVERNVSVAERGAVIRYVNGRYVPDFVHVSVGSRVRWVNEDDIFWPASNLHPTHKEYPGSGITKCRSSLRDSLFDSCEALGREAEYSFVFEHAGEWRFHDHINPRANGVVIVSR